MPPIPIQPKHEQKSLAGDWRAIIPSDTVPLDYVPRGIYIGTGGDIALKSELGNLETFKNVPSGSVIPCLPFYVMATNTTATDLIALY